MRRWGFELVLWVRVSGCGWPRHRDLDRWMRTWAERLFAIPSFGVLVVMSWAGKPFLLGLSFRSRSPGVAGKAEH